MRRRMFMHGMPEDWMRHHGGFGPFGHGHPPFPPPGPWGFPGRGRGRGRRGRGNVRAAILQLLEDEDLITGEEVEGRKRFALTEAGRAEAERHAQRAPWEEATEGIAPA